MSSPGMDAKYGINIKKYCAEHETEVLKHLSGEGGTDGVLEIHERKLQWLQHERLVHLLVTLFIAALFLFSIWLCIALSNPLIFVLVAVVVVLLGAYIRHYFFLENTVQRWYVLFDEMHKKTEG